MKREPKALTPTFSIPSRPIPRRALLRGAGGIAVGLPFLEAMRPRVARAATMPKRFVVFFSANGMIKDQWQPSGTSETSFTLSPILMPLASHQSDLLIMRGLANEASYIYAPNAHDASCATMLSADKLVVGPSGTGRAGHVLDGTSNGPSIDQEIARLIGGATKLPSLELGVQSTTTILEPMVTRICYRGTPGNAKSVPLEDDPKKVFTRLFMDAGASATTLEALRKKRKSVLDFVQRDFERLQGKIGAADKAKLDRHLTTVRQFEMSLDNAGTTPTTGSCMVPPAPTVSLNAVDCVQDGRPARCYGDYEALGKAQMDLLVLALACDLTRVVTLQWSTAESTVYFKSLGAHGEHHLMSHDATGNRNDLIKIDTWYAQKFSYLLDGLKSHTDADGTSVLDSSVVLWVNELSDGDTHNRRDLGWIIAGKGNGAIRTGRNVKYTNNPTTNQLFVSLLNMFGSPTTTFGANQFNKGTLAGLS